MSSRRVPTPLALRCSVSLYKKSCLLAVTAARTPPSAAADVISRAVRQSASRLAGSVGVGIRIRRANGETFMREIAFGAGGGVSMADEAHGVNGEALGKCFSSISRTSVGMKPTARKSSRPPGGKRFRLCSSARRAAAFPAGCFIHPAYPCAFIPALPLSVRAAPAATARPRSRPPRCRPTETNSPKRSAR